MMGSTASPAQPDPDGRLPLLQRLQHAISRGDLPGLIAAVAAAEAEGQSQTSPERATSAAPQAALAPGRIAAAADADGAHAPRLVLSRHLLFSAARAGHAPVVGWLLDRHEAQQTQQQTQQQLQQAAPTLVDNRGDTLLHSACRHGHLPIVTLLLERGFHAQIPPHLWRNHRGRDPFLEAVVGQQKWYPYMNDRLVKRLLAHHPSFHHAINLQDADGRTALWYCCFIGNHKLARLLLRAGADPTLASFPPPSSAAGVMGSGAGAVDETAGTTPVEVLRRRRRARGFIRMVEDAAPWRAARIARARLLGETRDALRRLLARPLTEEAAAAAGVLKAVPAFLRPRVLGAWDAAAAGAAEGGADGVLDPVVVALEALPVVEMGPDVVVEAEAAAAAATAAAATPTGQDDDGDGDAMQHHNQEHQQQRQWRRLAAAVAHVVDGGGLKPELLLELQAFLGGGRAARP